MCRKVDVRMGIPADPRELIVAVQSRRILALPPQEHSKLTVIIDCLLVPKSGEHVSGLPERDVQVHVQDKLELGHPFEACVD